MTPPGEPGGLAARSLETLEWEKVARALAGCAMTEAGREGALSVPLPAHPDRVRALLAETREMRAARKRTGDLPLSGVRDCRTLLERASRGAPLEPRELLDVVQTLEAAESVRRVLAAGSAETPLLWGIAGDLRGEPSFRSRVASAIDPAGNVVDTASPALERLRQRVARLGGEIRKTLEGFLADPGMEEVLQDRFYTLRDGRFVLPVKTEARQRMGGIVHGRSGSGHSFFVEPTAVVDLNNDLTVAEEEEREEVARILRELTQQVASLSSILTMNHERLTRLDLAHARALLAERMDASEPRIVEDGSLDLRRARHPLLVLAGHPVVPNDIPVGRTSRFLILTGPNTGGKTVALKTAGLLVLMARAGLHLPAAPESEVTPLAQVFADIGDDQSLEAHLSSFSGHLLKILEIRKAAGPGTLVLLDELVSGTDPREGAALARALLEDLAERGATGIVTTHYHELKALAAEDPRFENAGMDFDPGSFRPTYRLLLGLPGRSSALAIARRLGLEEGVVGRAEALHGGEGVKVDSLLEELEGERQKLDAEMEAARRLREGLDRLNREQEQELKKLRSKERKFIDEERAALASELTAAREEIAALLKRIREREEKDRAEAARRRLKDIETAATQRIVEAERAAKARAAALAKTDWTQYPAGTPLLLTRLGQEAKLLGPPDRTGMLPVQVGIVRMTVPADEAEVWAGKAKTGGAPKPPAGRKGGAPAGATAPASEVPFTPQTESNACDLRGLRADEALDQVDSFLDNALRRTLPVVILIHGHGTGQLRDAVRKHLQKSPYVQAYRPGVDAEGGNGVTVALLRD